MRRRVATCIVLLLLAGASPRPAHAAAAQDALPGRVVLLWLDHTTLDDWRRPGLPNFAALLEDASLGLLAARTASDSADPVEMRASAAATVGAGAPARVVVRDGRGTLSARGKVGELARTFAVTSLRLAVVGGAGGEDTEDRTSRLALSQGIDVPLGNDVAVADRSFPTGRRTDLAAAIESLREQLQQASVVLVDAGDTARVERALADRPQARAAWMARAMTRADELLGAMRALLTPEDVLIVAAPTPPRARAERDVRLGVVAIAGGTFGPGLLTSRSTRLTGLVPLVDLAPTILRPFGLAAPPSMHGHVLEDVPSPRAPSRLAALEQDLVAAAERRTPLTRLVTLPIAFLALLALGVVLSGRGRARRTRLPRGVRDGLATALVAAAVLPVLAFASPLLGGGAGRVAAILVAAAVAIALVARVALAREGALAVVLFAWLAATLADLATGGELAARSPLAPALAADAPLRGLDPATSGLLLGGLVLGIALALDRAPALVAGVERRAGAAEERARVPAAALVAVTALAGVVVLLARTVGTPAYGGGPATALVAVSALAVLAVRAPGGPRRTPQAVWVALAVAVGGAALAVSFVRGPGEPSGRDLRIFDLAAGGVAPSWVLAAVACGAVVALLARRRPHLLDRAMWGRPLQRAALPASVAAGVGALVGIPGGFVSATLVLTALAAATLVPLLAPDR